MSTTSDTPPLDATARAALARRFESLKQAALAAKAESERCDFDVPVRCSPDVILALLAAVERGAEDTARLDWLSEDCAQNAQLIDIVDGEWRATTYNGAGQVETVHESMRDAIDEAMAGQDRATARAHPPIQETDADAE